MTNIFNIVSGDTKQIVIQVRDSNSDAIDISGYSFFFTLKEFPTDPDSDAMIKKDGTVGDGTSGNYTLTLTTSDTDVTPGDYVYDIQMKDTSGYITTLVIGKANIIKGITTRTTPE